MPLCLYGPRTLSPSASIPSVAPLPICSSASIPLGLFITGLQLPSASKLLCISSPLFLYAPLSMALGLSLSSSLHPPTAPWPFCLCASWHLCPLWPICLYATQPLCPLTSLSLCIYPLHLLVSVSKPLCISVPETLCLSALLSLYLYDPHHHGTPQPLCPNGVHPLCPLAFVLLGSVKPLSLSLSASLSPSLYAP